MLDDWFSLMVLASEKDIIETIPAKDIDSFAGSSAPMQKLLLMN